MTIIRTSLIAAFGLLTASLITPASAGTLVTAKLALDPGVVSEADVSGLHAIGDRGSWKKPKSYFKRGHDHGYERRDRHSYRKHFKKKKHYRRGYRRGFDSGYDEGYYDGRRRSRFGHHHHYPRHGYRGGVFFGDGGGSFRFRF